MPRPIMRPCWSWRYDAAGFGEFNAANFHFSETAVDMVETMKIKAFVLDYRVPLESLPKAVEQAYEYAQMTTGPSSSSELEGVD